MSAIMGLNRKMTMEMMNMIEVKTKIGTLYLEEKDCREEYDRIKVFDSLGRYFDYFCLEYIEEDGQTIDEFYEQIKRGLTEVNNVDKLLDYFGINAWTASIEWTDLLEDMYGFDGFEYRDGKIYDLSDGTEITLDVIMENEYVNKIGSTYIFVCNGL